MVVRNFKSEKKKINDEIYNHEDNIAKLKTEEKQFISAQEKVEVKTQKLRDSINSYKLKLKEKEL